MRIMGIKIIFYFIIFIYLKIKKSTHNSMQVFFSTRKFHCKSLVLMDLQELKIWLHEIIHYLHHQIDYYWKMKIHHQF